LPDVLPLSDAKGKNIVAFHSCKDSLHNLPFAPFEMAFDSTELVITAPALPNKREIERQEVSHGEGNNFAPFPTYCLSSLQCNVLYDFFKVEPSWV
jgi:hypothetical protein